MTDWLFYGVGAVMLVIAGIVGWLIGAVHPQRTLRIVRKQKQRLEQEIEEAQGEKALAGAYWQMQVEYAERLEKELALIKPQRDGLNRRNAELTAQLKDREEEIARLKSANEEYEVKKPKPRNGKTPAARKRNGEHAPEVVQDALAREEAK